jgi:hypothetical protein
MTKDEEIIENIKNGRKEEAEQQIRSLESDLRQEKTKYNQRVLKERIQRLKKIYLDSEEIMPPTTLSQRIKKPISFNIADGVESKRTEISNRNGEVILVGDVIEIIIKDCRDVHVPYFRSENSVYLKNIKDSTICCRGQQIRISGCENIILRVSTPIGVFMEESRGIKIMEFGEEGCEVNRYDNVHDFSNPLDDSNYTIIRIHAATDNT